jgi:predicted CoA-binding protein
VSLLTADAEIAALLMQARRIALLGASDKPDRAAYGVMRFLLARGHEVVPVNPALAGQALLGQRVVVSLAEVGGRIDMVDVFRRADAVPEIVEEAIAAGAAAIWLQLGVVHEAAAARAVAAGLDVVMDRCPVIEARRLGLSNLTPD